MAYSIGDYDRVIQERYRDSALIQERHGEDLLVRPMELPQLPQQPSIIPGSYKDEATNWTEFFNRFRYKPNIRFAVHVTGDGMGTLNRSMLIATSWVENTYRPGETIVVRFQDWVPDWDMLRTMDARTSFVLEFLDRMERHETREFFKYEGVMVFDPHADGNREF